MITGGKLIALLDQHDKTGHDLVRYVCGGLPIFCEDGFHINLAGLLSDFLEIFKQDIEMSFGDVGETFLEIKSEISSLLYKHESITGTISHSELVSILDCHGTETLSDLLLAEGCYYFERKDVERFINADDEISADTDTKNIPPYLDPKHPAYSSELAVAVKAWIAVYVNGWGETSHNESTRVEEFVTAEYRKKSWQNRGSVTLEAALSRIKTVTRPDTKMRGGRSSKG